MSAPDTFTYFPTIPLSGSISESVELGRARTIAVAVPNLTSCACFLQGAFDVASAAFARVHSNVSSGEFRWFPGSASAVLDATVLLAGFAFARVETGVPQSALRSLAVILKA